MNYKIALITLILAISCVFSQISAVSYEREDLAVLSVSGADMAHVELTNAYTKVGTEMYLTDCGLTTCYLTLVITPDAPLDARTIIGRVAGGNAEYVGAEVYETRVVPVPRNVYKTVERNYTEKNNVTNTTKIIFYNETVLDKVVIDNLPVADWYALNPELSAGVPRMVRLEYHKEPWAKADLVPELNGVRVENWAWWNSSWTSYQETNITCPTCNGVYYFNLTFPVSVSGEMRFTTNVSGTETECGGLWKNVNATAGEQEWIVNCTLNGTTTIRGYYNNNTGVSDLRNISKACDLGDDYPGSAYDTSKWDLFGNAPSVSGGLLRIDADEGLQSDRTFGVNKVVMFYANPAGTGGTNYIGFSEISATDYIAFLANNGVAPNGNYKARNINAGATTSEDTGVAQNSVSSIFKVARNASANSIFYINTTKTNTISTNLETGNLRVSTNAGGSASTYYVEYTCVYDGLWLAGYNASFSAWSGEINDTSTPINITPFTVTNQNYTIPQVETVKYNYSINYTLGTNDTSSSSANLEYLGVNFTGTCSNVSKNYSCYYNGLESAIVAINNSQNDAVWIIEVTNESGSRTERASSVTIGTIWGAWPSNTSSIIDIVEGATFNTTAYYTTASGVNMTLIAALTFNTSYGTAVCAGGSCVVNQTAPSVSSATIYGTNGTLNISSPFWRYYGGNVTEAVRNVSLFQNYSITSGYTMSYSGTVTNPNNANDSNWGTGATLNDGATMTFNYTLNQLYNLTWYVKDSGGTRALAVPSDCWRESASLRVSRAGTYFRYWCLNYTNDAYVNFSQVTPGTYLFYEQNLSALRSNYSEFIFPMARVLPVGLTDCSVGSPLFNYTCWNELDGSSETCNYSQTFILNTTTVNQIETFSGYDSAWSICFYPSTLIGNVSSTEEIYGTGFDTRFFYIFSTPLSSSVSYNETRWIGDSATTKLTFVYVKSAGVGEPGVYIYVQRLFIDENSFKTVGMGKTNDDGTAVVYLEPNDAFYKFVVVDSTGAVLYTSSTQQAGCASTAASCSVTLNIETSVVDFWDYVDGISSACTFDDTTKIYSCAFTVASGTSKYFVLDCYRWAQFGNKTLNCSKNTTTASGTLWCDLGDASTTGTFVCYLQSYSTGLILQEDTFNWAAIASWGTTGLFIALILIAIMAWVGTNFGPSMTILLAYVGFVVSWLFQFVDVDLLGIVGLGVVAGALMYVIKH
jgi:hypothetical protein